MKKNRNEDSAVCSNDKGLPLWVRLICYLLLLVILVVCVFLGIRSYGRVTMRTAVGYALGNKGFWVNFHRNGIDNVSITVINADKELEKEGVEQIVEVTVMYPHYTEDYTGEIKTTYKTMQGMYIVFESKDKAEKYCNKVTSGQTDDERARYTLNCYYFDLPQADKNAELISGVNLTIEEENYNNELKAIRDLNGFAYNLNAYIYKIFG